MRSLSTDKASKPDENRFNKLFTTYYPSLCNHAFRFLSNMEIAQEVAQNAFIKLWEKGSFDQADPVLLSFLYTSVRNECIDIIRHEKQQEKYKQKIMLGYLENTTDSFEDLISEELQQAINDCIAQLPNQCRNVFIMNRFENLKYKEIAEKLGISIKAVEAHISKGLQILRDKLSDYLTIIFILSNLLTFFLQTT